MPTLWGHTYTRAELLRRVADLRQLADIRPFELSDGPERGARCLRMRNAAGLDFTIIADRGMGLYDLQFHGVPLAFVTAAGVVHPSYTEPTGFGWLRTWPGGFLTPCGLTQVGSPVVDGDEELGIHGRVAGLPAQQLRWGAEWHDERYVLWVEGALRETRAMGVNLILKRRVFTALDVPRLWIEDRIENAGDEPAPLMFLQHFNLGFPLVDSATRLILPPHTTEPRDDIARPGVERCAEFGEPIDGYQEQVFYHDLQPTAEGKLEVHLINPSFANSKGLSVTLHYAKADYPVLVQWKMMRAGFYVMGIEPANCHVEGRVRERERGTLQLIAPHETRTFSIEVEIS